MVRRTPLGVIGLFAALILLPTTAVAQSSGIAGSVKDSTGGVLPGVSVEASSPVLIEKVRTAVTDDQGRYTIVNLNPGTYTVTFSLAGFNTSKQEGIAVTSSGTATVNAELRVGAVEETLTVSGQAPTVDTRNVAGSRVLEREVLDQLPVSRSTMTGFAAVTVGIYTSRSIQDVGGTNAENQTALAAHGNRSADAIALWEGLSYNSMMATGAGGGAYPLYTDQGAVQEVAIDVSANNAEIAVSGVRTNLIPKEGGNTLKGSMVSSYAPGSWQSNNSSAELRAQGLVTNTKLVRIYDANPSLGGAIKQSKLWFFAAYRYWGTETGQANAFFAQDPLAWTYSPNLSRPATTKQPVWSETGRLTWQASARSKFGYFIENQDICRCSVELSALVQPEATTIQHSKPARLQIFTWSMPLSNKVLLDAGANYNLYGYNVQAIPQVAPTTIAAFELSTGVRSRAPSAAGYAFGTPTFNAPNHTYNQRFSLSYVPGSHNLKVGFQMREGYRTIENNVNGNMTDTLLNGVLQGITLFTTPFSTNVGVRADLGIFAQDQWTLKRLTVNYGGRFDYLNTYAGATNLPPTQFVGPRVFPEVRAADWKDISPRFGAAYDLFGNGQTAVKVSLGRYLAGETAGLNNAENPVLSSTNMAFRTWNGPNPPLDANGNFILNCDLTAPQANGQCGPLSVSTFGKPNVVNQWDPKLINGWFSRGSDWEFGTTVQHALTNRVSVGAGYYHRWYVNWYDASFTGQTNAAATATAGRPDVAVRNLAVTCLLYTSPSPRDS